MSRSPLPTSTICTLPLVATEHHPARDSVRAVFGFAISPPKRPLEPQTRPRSRNINKAMMVLASIISPLTIIAKASANDT